MATVIQSAPAKVNWYLEILGKRPDGFHELKTLFVRLRLADRVMLIERPAGIRIVTTSRIPKGPKNLAYRAALAIQEHTGCLRGVEIRIEKRIPIAAGLGGGSSDAAAVLLGLNRLWRLRLSRQQLLKIGATLGSDIPFFVSEAPYALGGGRGERIQPVFSKRRLWHVLIKPPFGISTQAAYAEYARLAASKPAFLTPPRGGVKILLRYLRSKRSETLQSGFFNSLEVCLNKRVIKISEIKERLLKSGAFAALLSGSGSTVFGIFLNKKKAHQAVSLFRRRRGYQVFVD